MSKVARRRVRKLIVENNIANVREMWTEKEIAKAL